MSELWRFSCVFFQFRMVINTESEQKKRMEIQRNRALENLNHQILRRVQHSSNSRPKGVVRWKGFGEVQHHEQDCSSFGKVSRASECFHS